jgi:hypothetical protein
MIVWIYIFLLWCFSGGSGVNSMYSFMNSLLGAPVEALRKPLTEMVVLIAGSIT